MHQLSKFCRRNNSSQLGKVQSDPGTKIDFLATAPANSGSKFAVIQLRMNADDDDDDDDYGDDDDADDDDDNEIGLGLDWDTKRHRIN